MGMEVPQAEAASSGGGFVPMLLPVLAAGREEKLVKTLERDRNGTIQTKDERIKFMKRGKRFEYRLPRRKDPSIRRGAMSCRSGVEGEGAGTTHYFF